MSHLGRLNGGEWASRAQWHNPFFSHQRGQQLRPALTWALPKCLLVHAEASPDLRARPHRGQCKKTSEVHGQRALQVKTKAVNAWGLMSLLSDTVVEMES